MNISKITGLNFLGKTENYANRFTANLRPLPPDTFERANAVEVPKKAPTDKEVSEAREKMGKVKFDNKSIELALKEGVNVDKISSIAKGMSNSKTSKVILRNCPFDKEDNYLIKSFNGDNKDKDNKTTLKLLDKDLNILAQEDTVVKFSPLKENPVKKITKTMDYRTNTSNVIEYNVSPEGIAVVDKETKVRRDKQGRLIRKEFVTASEVPGMYNVKYEFPNGKSRVLSSAKVDKKTGNTVIVKDMRSNDMTRTQYRYEDDPMGNRIMDYKITSPGGKVLMQQSQSFEKLGENKFRSTRNDKAFLIELKPESLDVTDEKTKEVTEIPLKGFIVGNEKKILDMLKTIPGDELINMTNSVVNIEEIPDRLGSYCQTKVYEKTLDGSYITAGTLAISDDPFVFLHELGHATDLGGKDIELIKDKEGNPVDLKIKDTLSSDDKEFMKIYEHERENYLKEFPHAQRNYIGYFIEEEAVKGQKDRGRKETVAETNALLNTYQTVDLLGIRTQYLQQHFPRTIAHLSKKLTQG